MRKDKTIHRPVIQKALGEWVNEPKVLTTLLVIPFILFMLLFNYLPLLGWSIAFMRYRPGVSFTEQEFVGFYHFTRIFAPGSSFLPALRNTLILSFLGILASPLPILLAILINEVPAKKYSRLIQSVTSLPHFVSWILVYAVAFAFFSVDGGVVNTVFYTKLGWLDAPSNVLANQEIAYLTQMLLGIWKNIGWSAIIYIAAITGIDQQLYEAADIDGAGRFRKTWHITIPGVVETYIVMLIISVANILSVGFEQYWVFQNPMTMNRLEVLDTFIYRIAMSGLAFDFSTAIGILKTTVSITLLFIVNNIAKRIRGSGII